MARTLGIIQARTGSTRLPGKVMYPLDGDPVVKQVVRRVAAADRVDDVVVATTEAGRDDVVEAAAAEAGAAVHRGSESDVLERLYGSAAAADPSGIVRVTGDCPLVSPRTIDELVAELNRGSYDYVVADQESFPLGLGAEAFTLDSFTAVREAATEPHHREHVTPYYREQNDEFATGTVEYDDVFLGGYEPDHELRLTLDVADDYRLFQRIYDEVPFQGIVDVLAAMRHVEENDLHRINRHVRQKGVHD